MCRRPAPPLFPYTTLFRSDDEDDELGPRTMTSSPAELADHYGAEGVSLVLDAGPLDGTPSSVIDWTEGEPDRKSTRLNSSHLVISYAVFCLNTTISRTGFL